jgi:hypothetical protein
VVILPVKERDPRRAVIEHLAKRQAAETRAQNDNVRIHLFHLGNNLKCAVDESKSAKLMKANQGQDGPAKTVVFSSLIAILLGKTNVENFVRLRASRC